MKVHGEEILQIVIKSMKFVTEAHWTNIIYLSRGSTQKGHFPTCYDVIFLEIVEISKVLKNRIKCAYMGINRRVLW